MRKLLAVLMSVLMLASVLAMIPAAAVEGEEPEILQYTGNSTGLLISEMLHNSGYYDNQEASVTDDCFEYWELYNAGTETVNIFDYSLVASPMYPKQPAATSAYYNVWNIWDTEKKFVHKMDIDSTVVPSKIDPVTNEVIVTATDNTGMPIQVPYKLQNDAEQAEIKPGEFAIVWFVRKGTLQAFDDYMVDNNIPSADALNPREVFLKQYSSLNNGVTVDSNLKIFMVWGYKNYDTQDGSPVINPNHFMADDGSKNAGFMYGLVKDSFDISNSAVVDGQISSDVVALAPYGGALDSWKRASGNQSTIYVPSTTKPSYYAADRAYNDKPLTTEEQADYVSAGLAMAYMEAGCVHTSALPTPGALDKLQWALAFPDKAPNNISGGQANWADAYLGDYLATIFPDSDVVEDANEEDIIKITPPDRNKLQEMFFPTEEDTYEYVTRLSLVGKILIAVGAIVVVGAGAGAAFIIIKKKKA